jgi:putative membrane protein
MSFVHITRSVLLPAAVLAWLGTTGCEKRENQAAGADSSMMDHADSSMNMAPAAPALNDAQIAHIAVTANSIDSASGAAALKRASDADVKDFARTMVRDHGAVNKQAVDLATRLSLTPEDNDQSRTLKNDNDQAQATMSTLQGAAFDKAYIDHEVAYHQAVLNALDSALIPGAQNADLKALLEQVRPNIAQHLQRAQQIQGKLNNTAS